MVSAFFEIAYFIVKSDITAKCKSFQKEIVIYFSYIKFFH